MATQGNKAPVRTVATIIAMVLATSAAVWLLVQIHRVLVWLAVAVFFAIVLAPLVRILQRRARMPRPLATLAALLIVFSALAGLVTALLLPLVAQAQQFVRQLPTLVQQAQSGQGPIGSLMRRFDVLQRIEANEQRITNAVQQLGDPALNVVLTAGTVVVGIVVVLVLTFLLALDGPRLVERAVRLLPERQQDRVRGVLHEASRAVTGYVSGQLLIALLYGSVTYVVLAILGVPFRNVVALFVGLTGLIPMVGATLGGVLAVSVSFLHSITAGIAVLIFVLVYQQLENHLLQPFVQSRTVDLSALAVLVSVLIGVELAGILGALLAIPVAGIIKVVGRDLWVHRRGARAGARAAAEGTSPRGSPPGGSREHTEAAQPYAIEPVDTEPVDTEPAPADPHPAETARPGKAAPPSGSTDKSGLDAVPEGESGAAAPRSGDAGESPTSR